MAAIPHLMPLGFIHRRTEAGAVIMLTNPEDSRTLRLGTPVTLWRYSPGRLAFAKVRGRVTRVGYVTATFETVESRIDPRWPAGQEIIRPKMPVYLAKRDSFEPDPSRMITPGQAEELRRLAEQHRRLTKGEARGPVPRSPNPATRAPSNNHHEATDA